MSRVNTATTTATSSSGLGQGSQYSDNCSRRAFALDSRTVWVEQQLIHQCLLPKDNLPIGPGEYSPKLFDRHISTPSLGRYREPADHLRESASSYASRSPSRGSESPMRSPAPAGESNAEFKTIHHFHEERQPFDPKHRYCLTPGPILGPDNALNSTNVLGVQHAQNSVHMDTPSPPDGRFPIKRALPSYEVKYDSLQTRPTPRYGTFSKDKRIYIPLAGDGVTSGEEDGQRAEESQPPASPQCTSHTVSRISSSPPRSPSSTFGPYRSIIDARCALVKLPKLKTKRPPVIVFKDTSYKSDRLAKPLDLTPSLVNSQACTHLFDKITTIPRRHKSSSFQSAT